MSWQHGFTLTLENCVGDDGLYVDLLLVVFLGVVMVENRPHPEVGFPTKPIREHQLGETVPYGVRHNAIIVKQSADFVHSLLDIKVDRGIVDLVHVNIAVQI